MSEPEEFDWTESLSKNNKIIKYLVLKKANINIKNNKGKGHAIQKGIQFFLNHKNADYLILMDSDLQHPADCIPEFLKMAELEEAKFILGNRKNHGGN